MKYTPLIFLALAALAFSQKSALSKKPAQQISNAFAKAGLVALKAIEVDGAAPELRDGEIYGDRDTIKAINGADSEARSQSESKIVDALNRLYGEKMVNNAQRQLIETNHELRNTSTNSLIKKMEVEEAMSHDPEIRKIDLHESSCFSALETSLRSRRGTIPQSCASITEAGKQ